ncbi:uncharacterized protein METZ01_LOCUS316084 [marine metagenome]|uniref:Uncharacterized protein n=1 Tax=marine metagenome TaxID=408172 RepID=A0A382NRH5_9ZZZZ
MKNILARGGVEFLAVLLGITASLWIDKNQKESEIELDRINVHQIIEKEISEIIQFTDKRLDYYNKQNDNIVFLFENYETFNTDKIEDAGQLIYDIFTTGTYMYNPNFSTFGALKNDGRFNLIDNELRKKLSELTMLMDYIKKIESNENKARGVLLNYISTNHPEIHHKYPHSGWLQSEGKAENFLRILENTRSDKTVWSLLSRKCRLTRSRNNRVKWAKDMLTSIQEKLMTINSNNNVLQ